jgi:hypothetical protein
MANRACLFCGSRTNLTKEHVYPKWLYRAFNVGGPITLMLGDNAVRTTPGLDVTLREVCGTCNNGWLHDLEGAFRSVMQDALLGHVRNPTILNSGAQRVVATWAIKTWLLLERAAIGLRGMAIESPDELVRLRRDDAPSDSSRVWIGAVRITDNTLSWLSSLLVRSPDNDHVRGVVGVFTIGAVVFHVFGPVEPPDGRPASALDIGANMRDWFVPIWPNQVEEVSWPPVAIFTLDDLQRHWPGNGVIIAP